MSLTLVTLGHKLHTLANRLQRSDLKEINAVTKKVSLVMQNNSTLGVAETWVAGSVGKGTAIKGQSDLDLVFLLSPKQSISNEEGLFTEVRRILKPISSIEPTTPYKATKIQVSGIDVDVLVTKIGAQGKIGEAQQSNKHVHEVVKQGRMFKQVAKILKYWKILPDDIPTNGYISSFQLEVILANVFNNDNPEKLLGAVKAFFVYVVESKLLTPIPFPPRKNSILTMDFNFQKKEDFLNRANNAHKHLQKSPADLSFLNL